MTFNPCLWNSSRSAVQFDGFGAVRRVGEVDAVEFEHGRVAVEKGIVAE
ncbi:MAG: hypothetical protein QM739_12185 [Propionivibrio sp.]